MHRLVTWLVLIFATAGPAGARIVGTQLPQPAPRANPFIGDSALPAPDIGRELADIRRDIARSRDSGDLTRAEARQLRRQVRLIGSLAGRYGQDGLSRPERNELQSRALYLRGLVNRPAAEGGTRPGGR
jgi:hypothetical protein